MADREDSGTRTRELLDVARELSAVRDADAEAGITARLVEALDTIRAGYGETITPTSLLEALRARAGWEWVKGGRRLAGLLNPLGITRRQLWNGGRRRWSYVLDAGQLGDLRARYGAGGDDSAEGLDTTPVPPPLLPEAVQSGDVVRTRMDTGASPHRASGDEAPCRSGEDPHG